MLKQVNGFLKILKGRIGTNAQIAIRPAKRGFIVDIKTRIGDTRYSQSRYFTGQEITDCQDEPLLIAGFIYGVNHQHEMVRE